MSDPLTWSPISLGRWFGTTVRVHVLLILFVVVAAASTAIVAGRGRQADCEQFPQTACWLGLSCCVALAIHELGHAAQRPGSTATRRTCTSGRWATWSARPHGPARASIFWSRWPGRSTSGAIFLITAIGLNVFAGAQFVWNPFGNTGRGYRAHPGLQTTARQALTSGLDHRLVRLSELPAYRWPTSCRPCRSTAAGCFAPIFRPQSVGLTSRQHVRAAALPGPRRPVLCIHRPGAARFWRPRRRHDAHRAGPVDRVPGADRGRGCSRTAAISTTASSATISPKAIPASRAARRRFARTGRAPCNGGGDAAPSFAANDG